VAIMAMAMAIAVALIGVRWPLMVLAIALLHDEYNEWIFTGQSSFLHPDFKHKPVQKTTNCERNADTCQAPLCPSRGLCPKAYPLFPNGWPQHFSKHAPSTHYGYGNNLLNINIDINIRLLKSMAGQRPKQHEIQCLEYTK